MELPTNLATPALAAQAKAAVIYKHQTFSGHAPPRIDDGFTL